MGNIIDGNKIAQEIRNEVRLKTLLSTCYDDIANLSVQLV